MLKTEKNSLHDPLRSHAPVAVELLRHGTAAIEPVSFGIPLERGRSWSPGSTGRLINASGDSFVAQLRPLSRWFDGSVDWLQVDAVIGASLDDQSTWHVEFREDSATDSSTRSDEFAAVMLPSDGFGTDKYIEFLLDRSHWRFVDEQHRAMKVELSTPQVRVEGPVRTTLEQHGEIPRLRGMSMLVQWDLYPTAALVRCKVTLQNSQRARHRGGLWDLGDPGSHLFEEFAFCLAMPEEPANCRLSVDSSEVDATSVGNFKLYQDSSGGDNWQSRNHLNRGGRIPCRFQGYQLWADGREQQAGLRASPVVSVESGDLRIGVAASDFWQEFPKSLSLDGNEICLGLFPTDWDDLHELQGGEQKTHEFWISVQPIDEPATAWDWVFAPTRIVPSAQVAAQDRELRALEVGQGHAADCFRQLASEALDGECSIVAQRERVDEYGWRSYGDFFADHEQLHYTGESPLISHYNNQFDVLRGLLLMSLSSRDVRWFDLAKALARHVIDIDIYHAESDRTAYSGGMFWFTDHYLHAQTSTHRTYSHHNAHTAGSYGGGPGAEHNYTSGLKLYYCLTGDESAKQAVVGLADWVLRMEDGRQTVLGLVDDGPTGLATVGHAKPGRGGANSINAVLDAWELTHRPEYCEFAEQLIRRCVHPDVDVADLDLLNLEVSWSYTMFYSSLAKYLALKEEAGQLDAMYVYARRSLLRLGEWMLAHERPYFDQRDKLEYPTEAWPAQELRKANVLRSAARYADEPRAATMRRRASEFGDRAWSDLMGFETRTVARALVLVMNEGLLDCASRNLELSPPPVVGEQFAMPPREVFATQRQRVVGRLKSPLGAVYVASQLLKPQSWSRAYRLMKRARST